MPRVEVEYPAPRRLGGEASATRRVLADRLGDHVESITCSPSSEELFCVSVDGERVWCTDPGGRIDPFEAVAAVRSQLA
jgi:hypothetical protein